MKKALNKAFGFAMRTLPMVMATLLVIHTNSTASLANGQPTPPASLKKYRKF
ncbi:MAG: hypothetical protein IJC09_05435 [Clostridia bacterium]|nr:hypothetical protein [Clostridia bacterium]